MPEKTYTISELKRLNGLFNSTKLLRYNDLTGKKQLIFLNGGAIPLINGTNAKMISLKDEMTFIEFLESKDG